MKVSNMTTSAGNAAANQFLISGEMNINDNGLSISRRGSMFQSYDSNIAFVSSDSGQTYLDEKYWDYSVTTGKYRNQFLGEGIAETRKKIESGEYVLTNLNG